MNYNDIFKNKNTFSNNKVYNSYNENDYVYAKDEIIIKYLEYFFMNKKADINTFNKYIKEDYLEKRLYRAQILTGEITKYNDKLMYKDEYEELCKSVEITLCAHNKTCFKIDEPVILDFDLKNVPNLTLSIFTIKDL